MINCETVSVALALHQARDAREVRLEPVLLLVLTGRLTQVGDHLVDVVRGGPRPLLASTLIEAREVALGRHGRHLGDRAHLGREVGGELVHVLRQPRQVPETPST